MILIFDKGEFKHALKFLLLFTEVNQSYTKISVICQKLKNSNIFFFYKVKHRSIF